MNNTQDLKNYLLNKQKELRKRLNECSKEDNYEEMGYISNQLDTVRECLQEV